MEEQLRVEDCLIIPGYRMQAFSLLMQDNAVISYEATKGGILGQSLSHDIVDGTLADLSGFAKPANQRALKL